MAEQGRYDLVVLGAGPGGYVACVRAAQLGLKVACVEKEARPGGVCLNAGCIPSKALLDSSEIYHLAVSRLAEYGVRTSGLELDLDAMMARKDQVVKDLSDSVRKLLEGHKIEVIRGTASVVGAHGVEVVAGPGAGMLLEADAILLATGSEPVSLPGLPFDGERIVSSTEALAFDKIPDHLGVVGGGAIGLELGSVWKRLGARVTVIEMMPQVATLLDGQTARTLERILTRQGLVFKLGTRVSRAEVGDEGVTVLLMGRDGREEEMHCDRLLVAVGRRPLTRGLGLDKVGVHLDSRTGSVLVDERYRTHVPSIYAIGDLIQGPMLAHKASAEGVAAVECMVGLPGEVHYDAIPSVVYTSPEVACVGLTEEELKQRGVRYCVGTYPFSGAARARCMGETEGFVKILAHAHSDRILGVHIIGPHASEMIAECTLAMEFGAASKDLARTVHSHPSLSEAIHEAALAARKCSIHAP